MAIKKIFEQKIKNSISVLMMTNIYNNFTDDVSMLWMSTLH